MSEQTERLLRGVATAAREALDALAHRWVIVDCTPREERAIMLLNDAVVALDDYESGTDSRAEWRHIPMSELQP